MMIKKHGLIVALSICCAACSTPGDHRIYAPNDDLGDPAPMNQLLVEQDAIDGVGGDEPAIIVTPAYDEFGRAGAKVTPKEGEPYYVDPHYEDPMPTNRHSDEPTTNSNWRVLGW